MHDRVAWLIKHIPLVQWLYTKIMSYIFRVLGSFISIDDRLVLFSSFGGKQYSDSPKVLYESMLKDPRFKDYSYVWAFVNPSYFELPQAKKVKIDSIEYFITALKAKIWITNVNIERGLHFKKESQIYLNTWHGTGPKKGGNAVKGRKDYDFSYVDIVCVDGQYARDEMVNWFNAADEHLLYSGRPREDELLSLDHRAQDEIRRDLNIPDNKSILLYMPTWREYGNKELDTKFWEESLGDQYVVLVRAHHFTKIGMNISSDDFWINVTDYPNVNELYLIADILISDYSSAFFDFGLLGKPMICYAYDYEKYESGNGLLMNLKEEFPNGVKKTEVSFISKKKYKKNVGRPGGNLYMKDGKLMRPAQDCSRKYGEVLIVYQVDALNLNGEFIEHEAGRITVSELKLERNANRVHQFTSDTKYDVADVFQERINLLHVPQVYLRSRKK